MLGIDHVIIVSKNFGYEPFIGSVCVQDTLIAEVRNRPVSQDECTEWIDGRGKILMPGLVNCHCHGDMTLARGLGDDMTLGEQIEAFRSHNWFYEYVNDDDRYYARQLAYCEALLAGVTFICDNMYWSLGTRSIQAMKETGIKGALVEDIRLDFADSDSLVSDSALREFSAACRENNLVPVIGLPAEEDYETARLHKVFERAHGIDALQTLHLAENQWRRDLIQKKYGMTPIEYLACNGFLHDRLIGSHVVYAAENEISLLKESKVKVANTPLCEMKIADGIAPVPAMVRQGITVGIGTDGALWNNSGDIFREMKGMSLLHTVNSGIRCLSKSDILDMATSGGAAVFGKETEFGMIQAGMKADMILIDADKPHLQPLIMGKRENVCSAIVFSATGGDVSDVFVNGKRLVKDGVLTGVDVPALIGRVRQTAEKINDN
ncbi:MAG: amidohydrolase family protein [Treponema sp.]|jgi:5-methylthioadenosine/S-adenosylhomocysteine deaminase|nr:amidohydrolase family protein [Treponema sp.]